MQTPFGKVGKFVDNLAALGAKRHGDMERVAELREDLHVVRPGDTLGSIAAQYGVTIGTITQANGISDPGDLEVGRVLNIPR